MTPMEEARNAWRQLVAAERTRARLANYPRMNAEMRTDFAAAAAREVEARAVLTRILG